MRAKCCAFLICLLVAAPVLAARPVKQPTPAVPVVADAAGAIVGPVVPVADGTKAIAAMYRSSNGDKIKVLFDAFAGPAGTGAPANLEITATGKLRIRGPVALWFLSTLDCKGQGYVQDTDLLEPVGTSFIWKDVVTKEYNGYAPVFVYPKAAQTASVGAQLFRVNWSAASAIIQPGVPASRLNPNGTCDWGPTVVTSLAGFLFPATLEGELSFTSPYTVE